MIDRCSLPSFERGNASWFIVNQNSINTEAGHRNQLDGNAGYQILLIFGWVSDRLEPHKSLRLTWFWDLERSAKPRCFPVEVGHLAINVPICCQTAYLHWKAFRLCSCFCILWPTNGDHDPQTNHWSERFSPRMAQNRLDFIIKSMYQVERLQGSRQNGSRTCLHSSLQDVLQITISFSEGQSMEWFRASRQLTHERVTPVCPAKSPGGAGLKTNRRWNVL